MTDSEWENLPEVGNLTRKKRRREERSYVVPDSVIVGDRTKNQYENALDPMQNDVRVAIHFCQPLCLTCIQQTGGFDTAADPGAMTNFVEIGQARDKILSLKLDQVSLNIVRQRCVGSH